MSRATRRVLGTLALLASVACQKEPRPAAKRQASTRTDLAGSGAPPASAPTPASAKPFTGTLHHTTHAMALPQPVPEPLMLDDGSESVIPLPANVRIVRGSEVVEATRDPDRKGTLVNVWASWCGSCKVEMPMLLEVQKRYEPRGIKLVLVSVDNAAQAGDAESFLKERGVEGTVLLAHPKLGYFKQALSPIWRGALPASFLYDNTGRLRYYWGAQVFESELVPILDGLLRGEDINGMANFKVRG